MGGWADKKVGLRPLSTDRRKQRYALPEPSQILTACYTYKWPKPASQPLGYTPEPPWHSPPQTKCG